MLDPSRPEVSDAVDACRQAGIRSSWAVARRVGIMRQPAPAVATGTRLDALDDDGLDTLLADSGELLLRRASPEHKMRVVTALQRRGDIVAVTGDDAKDAPALKHADIGVAMGASGTDGVDVIETAITPRSRAAGRMLAEITRPIGSVIATAIREGQPTVTAPEMWLQPGDELVVVSQAATEQEIHAAFQ